MWRPKRKRYFLLYILYIIFMPLVNLAPSLVNFDIWDDFKNDDVVDNVFNKNRANGTSLSTAKLPRVLNFFPVPFEEDCVSRDKRRQVTSTCNKEIFNNITYFVNPDFPDLSKGMTSCSVVVKKIDPEITQLRLDFIHFNLGQPNRTTGVCDDDLFMLSDGTSREFKLCGLNNGQHAYFDVDNINDTLKITMNFGNKIKFRLWEVRVIQIPFTQRVPQGCLQYHTGNTGIIQTMNFAENGRHLADQDYNICMRQEMGMCSIAYEPCHENAFRLGPDTAASSSASSASDSPASQNDTTPNNSDSAISQDVGSGDGESRADEACIDKIFMPCESEELLMSGKAGLGFCELAYCGSSFCPVGETTCRVESNVAPFTIGVQFGAATRQESPEDNLGMCLAYEQLPCME